MFGIYYCKEGKKPLFRMGISRRLACVLSPNWSVGLCQTPLSPLDYLGGYLSPTAVLGLVGDGIWDTLISWYCMYELAHRKYLILMYVLWNKISKFFVK